MYRVSDYVSEKYRVFGNLSEKYIEFPTVLYKVYIVYARVYVECTKCTLECTSGVEFRILESLRSRLIANIIMKVCFSS